MNGTRSLVKWFAITTALLLALALVAGGLFYSRMSRLEVERLSDDLYVIRGVGGNVAVLATDEGTVVVDTMTVAFQGKASAPGRRSLPASPSRW
jgi:hypothetical protein